MQGAKTKHIHTTSSYGADLKLINIHPHTPDWALFLALSIDYLVENWPSLLQEGTIQTKEMFSQQYEKKLLGRIREGGRILLLWKYSDDPVGFANAWIEGHEGHIAEFSILEKYRRRGLGRLCVQNLIGIAQQNSATQIFAEVDDGIDANYFWGAVMTNRQTGVKPGRNLYWCDL